MEKLNGLSIIVAKIFLLLIEGQREISYKIKQWKPGDF